MTYGSNCASGINQGRQQISWAPSVQHPPLAPGSPHLWDPATSWTAWRHKWLVPKRHALPLPPSLLQLHGSERTIKTVRFSTGCTMPPTGSTDAATLHQSTTIVPAKIHVGVTF
jgi:hypothetical protein